MERFPEGAAQDNQGGQHRASEKDIVDKVIRKTDIACGNREDRNYANEKNKPPAKAKRVASQ
ncbi:MAG: hypothetical protein IPK78_06165 [Rhodospirillales bacterium]|nr:hypothetical protein [Rhodospirillales bacterium]